MELINYITDLINIINEFFVMIGDAGTGTLGIIYSKFPMAVTKVIEHPDYAKMYNVMIPIGISLAALYTLLDVMEKTSLDELTVDKIILTFAKLIAAIGFIGNGITVFKGLNGASLMLVDKINTTLGINVSAFDSFQSGFHEITVSDSTAGVFRFIGLMLELANPVTLPVVIGDVLLVILLAILIPIAAYQRAIKIGTYCLAAPIVFADTAGHGLKSSRSVRYVIQLFRAFLEYPVIYLSIYAVIYLDDKGVFTTAHGHPAAKIVFVVMLITCLFSSRDYIKSLFS